MKEAESISLHVDTNLGLEISYCPTYDGYSIHLDADNAGAVSGKEFPTREEYIKHTITISEKEIYFTKDGILYIFNQISYDLYQTFSSL